MRYLVIISTIIFILIGFKIIVFPNIQSIGWYYEIRSSYYLILAQIKQKISTSTSKEKIDILIIGDSITNGQGIDDKKDTYPLILNEKNNHNIKTICQNGWTTLDGLKNIDKVLSVNSDTVIIQLGGNDLARGFSSNQVIKNIRRIVNLIQKNNESIQIILLLANKNLFRSVSNPNIPVIDYSEIYSNQQLYFDPVSHHPNVEGHERIAELVEAILKK